MVDHLGVVIREVVELGRQVLLEPGCWWFGGGGDGGIDTGVDDALTERPVRGRVCGWRYQLERRHGRPKCVNDLVVDWCG